MVVASLFTTAAAFAVCAHALQPMEGVSTQFEFDVWKEHYGLTFETLSEEAERLEAYTANRLIVKAHNMEASQGLHSFTLELNAFAAMSNAEYRSTMLGLRASDLPRGASTFEPKLGAAPDSWDWRDVANVVNPVKNQGACGSCWAFSAVATMEGALNLKTGNLTSLSEQELVDCVNDGQNTCTIGGEMYQGVDYGVTHGMMSESDYSYKATSGNKCGYDANKNVHTFSGYKNITSGDEAALKEAVHSQPIVSVGIDASSIWFQLYFGGVYDHPSCKNKADELDHGVAVVGYGRSKASAILNAKDYWLVRNSWGSGWGKGGYIHMVRNENNQCGVATQACFANV